MHAQGDDHARGDDGDLLGVGGPGQYSSEEEREVGWNEHTYGPNPRIFTLDLNPCTVPRS